MHRCARLVIALLLAIVVPWHAVAATAMVGCDPAPEHAHHAAAAAAVGADHAMHHGHDDRAAPTKVKCLSASACCVAAVLPSPTATFDASTASQRFAQEALVGTRRS